MSLILSPDQSDNSSTSLLLALIEYMQVWPNFALLALCLGNPDELLSDQQLLGIDKRCQSESVIIKELGKVFESCQPTSLDHRLFFTAKFILLFFKLIHVYQ